MIPTYTSITTGVLSLNGNGLGELWAQASSLRAVGAIVLGLFLLSVLYQRFQSDTDPSLWYQSETAAGSMGILLSGVHVTLALALGIVALTWPFVLETPSVALALGVGLLVHYWLEKREVMG